MEDLPLLFYENKYGWAVLTTDLVLLAQYLNQHASLNTLKVKENQPSFFFFLSIGIFLEVVDVLKLSLCAHSNQDRVEAIGMIVMVLVCRFLEFSDFFWFRFSLDLFESKLISRWTQSGKAQSYRLGKRSFVSILTSRAKSADFDILFEFQEWISLKRGFNTHFTSHIGRLNDLHCSYDCNDRYSGGTKSCPTQIRWFLFFQIGAGNTNALKYGGTCTRSSPKLFREKLISLRRTVEFKFEIRSKIRLN